MKTILTKKHTKKHNKAQEKLNITNKKKKEQQTVFHEQQS
jgi:hypothetical protein